MPSVANPYFAEMAGVIISEANSRRYTSIVIDSMEDEENQRHNLATLIARKVDGIIAAPCGSDSSLFEEIRKMQIPLLHGFCPEPPPICSQQVSLPFQKTMTSLLS